MFVSLCRGGVAYGTVNPNKKKSGPIVSCIVCNSSNKNENYINVYSAFSMPKHASQM